MARKRPDDPAPWHRLASRYLLEKPPWLILRQDHYRLPSGKELPTYWISEFPPWVNVIAVTEADEVVLIRQYRPGLGAVHFELPAGVVDSADTDLETAARRELREETGYGGGTWTPFMTLSPNPALQTNLSHTFLAQGVRIEAEPNPEDTEDLRIDCVPIDHVDQMLTEGAFIQALHAAPLLRFLLDRTRKRT